jgi:Stage II sporulation protein E (SpoIIE)
MLRNGLFASYLWMAAALCLGALPAQGQASEARQDGVSQGAVSHSDPRNVDASRLGEPIVLGPEWLFASGDDPTWASPAFDDHGWKTISAEHQFGEDGYRDLTAGWYRIHLKLPERHPRLTLLVGGVVGSYEVYANGTLLGGAGSWSGLRSRNQAGMWSFAIPEQAIGNDGVLTIALRFRVNVGGAFGTGTSQPLGRTSQVILEDSASAVHESVYQNSHLIFEAVLDGAFALLVGLVSLALFRAMPGRREYFFAGLFGLSLGLSMIFNTAGLLDGRTALTRIPMDILYFFETVSVLEFTLIIVRQRRNLWIWLVEIALAASALQNFWDSSGFTPMYAFYLGFGVFFTTSFMLEFTLVGLLLETAVDDSVDSRARMEARVMLPAICVLTSYRMWSFINFLLLYLHTRSTLWPSPAVHLLTYPIGFNALGDILFLLALLVFLVLRTVGIARERARIGAELEAARTMQQLLLTRDGQQTPGFEVDSVYYPANEVGGDFFLVASRADGALIAIVGDVSGKGLQAAMRVSMILGVLRREDSWEPGVVLRNLNEALENSGQEGFTTACCVRIDADGLGVLANAGHIAPYLDACEVATAPALPLGLVAGLEYKQVEIALRAGERLVLMSDGVVEARVADGALLGFERVAAMTRKSAAEIADAAQAFGQDDDITVLTLARV